MTAAARIHALVTRLTAADPAACDRSGLAELVGSSQQVRAWLDAFDATVAVCAARLEEPAASLAGRRSVREAEATARRGEVCSLLPGLHDALAAGAVSAGHADAVARVAASLDERGRGELAGLAESVVASAAASSVEEFSKQMTELGRALAGDEGLSRQEWRRRQRCVRRWVDRQTGLCHTHLTLDPESDERVSKALVAAVHAEPCDDERSWEQRQADALVGLITGARSVDRRTPEVVMLIDAHTMRDGLHGRSVCETGSGQAVPPETVRRIGCDATVVPVIVDDSGAVLAMGRTVRTATHQQRVALRAMHRSCAHPDCSIGFDTCDIHHVKPWVDGGSTDLDNLVPLCNLHHHAVHEGGWTLVLRADRTVELRRPDGSEYHHGTTVDVAPEGVAALLGEALEQILTRNRHGPPAA